MPGDSFSEATLCAEFRDWAQARGWLAHPEIQGWDFVLVKSTPGCNVREPALLGYEPGDQVGVQAKLVGSVGVLYQASAYNGPAYRFVLVRRCSPEFLEVARKLNLVVLTREYQRPVFGRARPWLRHPDGFKWYSPSRGAVRFNDHQKLELPPIITDLPAGLPSPRSLTPWRVKAIRLCSLLRQRGWLTKVDFKAAKVDMRRWQRMWLVESVLKTPPAFGRAQGTWIARPGAVLPDVGWEAEAAKILALDTANPAAEPPR